MRRAFCAFLLLLSGVATILFSLAWYDRYWRWRGCFNEAGRCFDPETQDVYLEQAGLVWGLFLLVSLGLLVLSARRLAHLMQASSGAPTDARRGPSRKQPSVQSPE